MQKGRNYYSIDKFSVSLCDMPINKNNEAECRDVPQVHFLRRHNNRGNIDKAQEKRKSEGFQVLRVYTKKLHRRLE